MMRFVGAVALIALGLIMMSHGEKIIPTYNDVLVPYAGVHQKGVDPSTMKGKIFCGYQGWFTTQGDGSPKSWIHWTSNGKRPNYDNIRVDAWPDLTEISEQNRYGTDLKFPDGSSAYVFSSLDQATVNTHYSWMRNYGIDGAFVQRFATGLNDEKIKQIRTVVLSRCREAANQNGRSYSVMYDLSGLKKGAMNIVKNDWRELTEKMTITKDQSYQRHQGKPLVTIWGVGFSGDRLYTLDECRDLIDYFHQHGCAVMLGVPMRWRDLNGDAVNDPKLLEVIAMAEIVSPWTVGRYADDKGIDRYQKNYLLGDVKWCQEKKSSYLPVVFPGFSWRNMNRDSKTKFDAIPRHAGQFLWSQCLAAKRSGVEMLYIAMFDEVDEGTAIFKCNQRPPDRDEVRFLHEPTLPTDHYLKVSGAAGMLLRDEISASPTIIDALINRQNRMTKR